MAKPQESFTFTVGKLGEFIVIYACLYNNVSKMLAWLYATWHIETIKLLTLSIRSLSEKERI